MLLHFKYNRLYVCFITCLIILLHASGSFAGHVTLSWDPPVTNKDGTVLTDLAGYIVYYGTTSGKYNYFIDMGNTTTCYINNLTEGSARYFAVTAYDTSGNESDYSNEVKKVISSSPVNDPDIIIDNGDPETSSTGNWKISRGADPYSADSYWSRNGSTYTWTFTPTESGYHEVSMWWTEWSSRSTSVPVEIEYMGGTDTFSINQQQNGGQWNFLGQYLFEAGVSYDITVTARSGPSSTSADAVQFVYVPVETIIDNGDPETSSTGNWKISRGADPFDDNSYWGRNGSTYTWTFTPAGSGYHEVSMWWTQRSSRSTSVPVEIEYMGGTDNFSINQQQNGGQWNVLGQYQFEAGVSYDITVTSPKGSSSTCADAVRFN